MTTEPCALTPQDLVGQLRACQQFFDRSTSCLAEADSTYKPAADSMTVSQQVAHVAWTIDWLFEGAFRPEGFDMNFEQHMKRVFDVDSLAAAQAALQSSFDRACEILASKSIDDLIAPLPEGPVMGGKPRLAIVEGISEHTAHHRGALTVYSRLLGKTPPMPYM